MSNFDKLNTWLDLNAPNLNKEVLYTLIQESGSDIDYELCSMTITNSKESGFTRFYCDCVTNGKIGAGGGLISPGKTTTWNNVIKNSFCLIIESDPIDVVNGAISLLAQGDNFYGGKALGGTVVVKEKVQNGLLGSSNSGFVFYDEE